VPKHAEIASEHARTPTLASAAAPERFSDRP
jgi:hypothetical protein